MYTSTLYTVCVRDRPVPYRGGAPEAEGFPAEGVLRDLARAAEADVPVIVARYTAVRAWLLRATGDPLAEHAAQAAAAHLAAASDAWAERAPLLRLTGGADPDETATLLEIADHADRRGHGHGAFAVLLAGYRVARRRARFGTAGTLATALGRLRRRHGAPASAWLRLGERLRRLAEACPPPSSS